MVILNGANACEKLKQQKAKTHRIPEEDEDDGLDPESAHLGESIYLQVS